MKNIFKFLAFFIVLSGCQFLDAKLDLDKIKNPEKDIYKIYAGFELSSVTKEDLDGDGNLDISIYGYDEFDNWVESYFMHNGDLNGTYAFMDEDEYWEDYDYDYYDTYENVEDYFIDIQDYNHIEHIVYGDVNEDGLDDALVIVNYDSDGYQSIDAYIFTAVEDGYYYYGMAETHYPMNYGDFGAYKDAVIKDGYFTIELGGEDPYWDRFITFKYEESEDAFLLHKDGGTVIDEDGNLVREQVLTKDDFGYVYFYDFMPDGDELFSIKQDFWVSSTGEFLEVLGNNRTIYLEEGVYYLDELSQLPQKAQENFESSSDWEIFYKTDFYNYFSADKEYLSISLTLENLRNVDIIGNGAVQFIIRDEMATVLAFESCEKIIVENIYMVHDVGGICGANVIDVFNCYDMTFQECTFDGSGELGVYASASYSMTFDYCEFTNCTDGAVEFIESDAYFESCIFEDNTIWHSLLSAASFSSIDCYNCSFAYNEKFDASYKKDPVYLFYAEEESYIYIDVQCEISDNNYVDEILNDEENVVIESGERY